MHLSTKFVPSDCDIVLAGDTHEGTILQHRDGIEQMKDYLLSAPNRFMIHMGDEIEAIMVDDRRYDLETSERSAPLQQMDSVRAQFEPIKDRILSWLWGNHPQKLHRFGNLTLKLCNELGIEYGTWTTKITFADDHGPMFKGFFCHGFRGRLTSNAKDYDQQQANLKAALKRKLSAKAGDVALMACGHTHLLMVVKPAPKLYLTDDGNEVKQNYLTPGVNEPYIEPDRRWYANTGSFLKLYGDDVSGYGEVAGYDPVELGYCVVEVRDRKIQTVRKVTL